MKKKVLIPTKLDAVARELLAAHGNYEVVQDAAADLPALAAKHPDTYAVIVRSEKVTPAVMDALPRLKVVVRAGAGFDNIDTRDARQKGIDVMNTPGANSNGVAEEVVAMMLADARHIVAADASCRAGQWEKTRFMGRELTGKTVGIVGLGNIGQLVARRLAGFEVRLLGYDPLVSAERAKELGVTLRDLESLFAESDYVTLHVPENDETRRMVNARLLARMKPGATIVNCARAGIVDEAALREAKGQRKLRFLNDVYPKDAEGPKSVADLADLMLPHLGASTFEANHNAARRAAEELIELDEKGVTTYIVNRDIPEGLDRAYCDLAYRVGRLCRAFAGRESAVTSIKTSFYGSLERFADWLLVPTIAGLFEEIDRSLDARAVRKQLAELGIEYVNRAPDPAKGYENSLTVEVTATAGAGSLRVVSLRGTVAEGTLMISRINDFNKLYFEPAGDTVFVEYDDRPGVIGTIGMRLAEAKVNIADVRNAYDPGTNRSLAIMKVSQAVPAELMASIAKETRAAVAFALNLK